MTIGDFINDPFGSVAKAGLDAAPDEVRETFHDVAESIPSPTLPESSSLIDSFSAGAAESDPMGAAGEIASGSIIPDVPDLSGVDVRNSLDIIVDDKENWDTNGPTEKYVETSPPEIVHPDPYADTVPPEPPTAGEQAQDWGAEGTIDEVFGEVF